MSMAPTTAITPTRNKSGAKRNGNGSRGSGNVASTASSPARTLTVMVDLPRGSALDESTAKRLLTLALVSSGHLSQSQGAQSLGISRYDLIDLMGEHSLPVVRLSNEESTLERQTLQELHALRSRHQHGKSPKSRQVGRSRAVPS